METYLCLGMCVYTHVICFLESVLSVSIIVHFGEYITSHLLCDEELR